jgi:hypothetical protein
MALKSILLLAALGLFSTAAARAEEGTYAQRMACMSDAFRLCSSEIPNADAVKACMIAKKAKLSTACLATWPKETASAR